MNETTTFVWGCNHFKQFFKLAQYIANFSGQLATKDENINYLSPVSNIVNIPILSIACGEEFTIFLSSILLALYLPNLASK